jgi:hypothetical protein
METPCPSKFDKWFMSRVGDPFDFEYEGDEMAKPEVSAMDVFQGLDNESRSKVKAMWLEKGAVKRPTTDQERVENDKLMMSCIQQVMGGGKDPEQKKERKRKEKEPEQE